MCYKLCVVALIILTAAPSPANSRCETQEIPEAELVKLAEDFVARNGYTDLPSDNTNLTREDGESETNINKVLAWRLNLVERKPYGISRGRIGNSPGWSVVFRFKRFQSRKYGLAVTMNLDGSDIRVEKAKFILRAVDKKF